MWNNWVTSFSWEMKLRPKLTRPTAIAFANFSVLCVNQGFCHTIQAGSQTGQNFLTWSHNFTISCQAIRFRVDLCENKSVAIWLTNCTALFRFFLFLPFQFYITLVSFELHGRSQNKQYSSRTFSLAFRSHWLSLQHEPERWSSKFFQQIFLLQRNGSTR